MSQYGTAALTTALGKDTTIDTTAGSATITGNSTAWLANVSQNDDIFIHDDTVPMIVLSVNSDTSITLAAPYYRSLDDVSYEIVRDHTENLKLPLLADSDRNGPEIFTRAMKLIDQAAQFGLSYAGLVLDDDLSAAPGSPSNGDLYIIASDPATGDDWFGQDPGTLAQWVGEDSDADWVFTAPDENSYAYIDDESVMKVYLGGEWQPWTVTANLGGVAADTLLALNTATNTHGWRWSTANAAIEARISSATVASFKAAGLELPDNYWIGLGAAAARIEFDNQTVDEVNILGARVGINTATPDTLLHILGTNAEAGGLTFESSAGTVGDRLRMYSLGNSSFATKKLHSSLSLLWYNSGGTQEMILDPNGRLGIGASTSPASLLSVGGGLTVGSTLYATTAAPTDGARIEGHIQSDGFVHDRGKKRVVSNVTWTTDTTPSVVTGLSVNVVAGQTYYIRSRCRANSPTAVGIEFGLGGTASFSSVSCILTGRQLNGTLPNEADGVQHLNALAAIAVDSSDFDGWIELEGTVVCNSSGTLEIHACQNTSDASAVTVYAGSFLQIERIS